MRIFIDADGCPVVKITIDAARSRGIPVTVVKNYAHVIESDYAEIITVDIENDAADYYIANHIRKDDILITQDYGLGAMALSKGARILTQNGLFIHNGNIMSLLVQRHDSRKMRKSQRIYHKTPKRTPENDAAFLTSLKTFMDADKEG